MSLVSENVEMEMEILNILTGTTAEPRSVIIGCGGGAARTMQRVGWQMRGMARVLVNTDLGGLQDVDADRKVCIGKSITFNSDSGGFTEVAERCAELAEDEIRSCLISKDVAFILAYFGGGTGTAVAPMVARMARGLGMVTFSICVLPFSVEGSRRKMAEDSVASLRALSDSVVVLDNDSLLKFADSDLETAFEVMDNKIVEFINGVTRDMSRKFISTFAAEMLAIQSEMALADGGSMVLRDDDIGAMADSGTQPSAFPDQFDVDLVNSGGKFERQ